MKTVGILAMILALFLSAPSAMGQAATRKLATVDALRRFPAYYHLQNILVRGEFVEAGSRMQFRADEQTVDLMLADGVHTTRGPVEIRAQLIDVGRLEPGDPRLKGYTGAARDADRWPRPGEELLLNVTGVTEAEMLSTVTVRALALEPWRYEGQIVTLDGQFRGRNLFGDLPGAPAKSKYDFVLRSGTGAVWVTGLRAKGRGFDLDVDARVDTGRWLEITGVVKRERSLVTIEATKIIATTPSTEVGPEEPTALPDPPAPVEVVFSSPSQDETDVATASVVRVQFSRGLNLPSIARGFAVSYVGGQVPVPLEFRTTYDFATRAVEIRFTQALAPVRTVKVEILDGLKGFDGAVVMPWSVTFTTGP